MNNVIIAPHPDDEIIGCFKILNEKKNIVIIYHPDVEQKRREEALKLKEKISSVNVQLFNSNIPTSMLNKESSFYFPDPIYEIHPRHRELGMIGESIARSGLDVTFYSTIMNAPYIYEVGISNSKENLLNEVYPSQSDMWKYEKKYILFEGFCKWIF